MYLRIMPITFLFALAACDQQAEKTAAESELASESRTVANSIYPKFHVRSCFGLREHHSRGGIRVRFADRDVIYWHGIQREDADRNRLRFRTGRQGAPSATAGVA